MLTGAMAREKKCPSAPPIQRVREQCGEPLGGGYTGAITGFFDLAGATCAADRVPGKLQPPDGYVTNATSGISGFSSDESDRSDPGKFTWYDKYASQPMPWIVSRFSDGKSETSVVCLTPGDVVPGSRDPETSAAGRVRAWVGMVVGVVAAGVAMM
ncbi:hypothetical protein OPT61_g6914 [Boeremia exigua]|uniref:Uncharacterized protein n=1 Tax=Boeremia exigua TaxID=749465 RepID=A0ACC2I5E2_9PLEO|nr:hypothetical protein OPT61_g6914 [Boeremia exigua]